MSYFDETKVQKTYPEATMIPAMKVWALPKNKKDKLAEYCGNGEYYGQIKKDGYFYQINKTLNYTYLFSRNESVSGLLSEKGANVPHIILAFENLPKDTIILGEIYYPNGTSKDVTTIMGCLAEKAIKRQQEEDNWIHYYIYDIIMYDGINLMNQDSLVRYRLLEQICAKHNLLNEYVELAKTEYDNLYNKAIEAMNAGEEGMVLKKKDAPYIPGKKPAWSSIKIKLEDTEDVVIMGFENATKEYSGKEIETWQYWTNGELISYSNKYGEEGWIPITKPYALGWKTSIEIGAYAEDGKLTSIGTVSSGLTDEMKEDFAKNGDKYFGQVIEVEFMQKSNIEQTLRHPRFKRFRSDKNANECTLKEIFN